MKIGETTVKYEQLLIEDIAILEVRHSHKELGIAYSKFVFIELGYLSTFSNVEKAWEIIKNHDTVYPIEKPKDKYFLEYNQLLNNFSDTAINSLLIDLLKKTNDYNGVNFIFPLISLRDSFSRDEVIWIINYSIEEYKIKKSFSAKSQMRGFIERNKGKIGSSLFERALIEFPRSPSI